MWLEPNAKLRKVQIRDLHSSCWSQPKSSFFMEILQFPMKKFLGISLIAAIDSNSQDIVKVLAPALNSKGEKMMGVWPLKQ